MCGYKHPQDKCPGADKECYNCHAIGHYTALCRCPRQATNNHYRTNSRSHYRNTNNCQHNSRSPSKHRQFCHRSTSYTCRSHHPAGKHRRSPTPRSYQVSHLISTVHSRPEDKLATDVASHGHASFHTTLQIITKQGSKSNPVNIDPGADINTITLSKCTKIFPALFTKAGNPKQKVLHPTRHT